MPVPVPSLYMVHGILSMSVEQVAEWTKCSGGSLVCSWTLVMFFPDSSQWVWAVRYELEVEWQGRGGGKTTFPQHKDPSVPLQRGQ